MEAIKLYINIFTITYRKRAIIKAISALESMIYTQTTYIHSFIYKPIHPPINTLKIYIHEKQDRIWKSTI